MAMNQLEQDLEMLVETITVLAEDVNCAAQLSEHADTPFARRMYVRSAFALFEGNLNQMKKVLSAARDRGEISLTEGELNGKCLTERVQRTIETFQCLCGATSIVDRTSSGWAAFRKATRLRNRITHPEGKESFQVTDE